jgi:hypothetical protein
MEIETGRIKVLPIVIDDCVRRSIVVFNCPFKRVKGTGRFRGAASDAERRLVTRREHTTRAERRLFVQLSVVGGNSTGNVPSRLEIPQIWSGP